MSYPPPISVSKECDLVERCKKLHNAYYFCCRHSNADQTKKPITPICPLKCEGSSASKTVGSLVAQAMPDKNAAFTLSCKTFRLRHSVPLSKIANAIFGRSTCLAPSRARALRATAPYGFTLAEVLITLVVLGIIAAITIPTLRNSLDDKKYRVPLKKTYAVLSEAFDQTFNFSNIEKFSSLYGTDNQETLQYAIYDELFTHLARGKVCCSAPNKSYGDSGCLAIGNWVGDCFAQPKDSTGTINKAFLSRENCFSFELKDGTSVAIRYLFTGDVVRTDDSLVVYGLNSKLRQGFRSAIITSDSEHARDYYEGYRYFAVLVDVNGKTGPNIAGKDVHAFLYTPNDGLIPAGADAGSVVNGNTLVGDCTGADNWGCTYKYMNSD